MIDGNRRVFFVVIITSIKFVYSLSFLGTEKDTSGSELRQFDTSLAKTFHIPMKIEEIMFFFSSF
mgnify:CR=1 FL=1